MDSVRGHVKGKTAEAELARFRDAAITALAAIRATGDPATAFRQFAAMAETTAEVAEWITHWQDWMAASMYDSGQVRSLTQLAELMGVSKTRVHQRVEAGRLKGNPVRDPGTSPEQLPVVAAIIIEPDAGVLAVHRVDAAPPWSFPAAEVEWLEDEHRLESPSAALIRRVPQETGLEIETDYVIGERIHPRTGRLMRYMLAHLTDPTKAAQAAHQEADPDADRVQWLTAPETRELMPDMFLPVRELIDRELAS